MMVCPVCEHAQEASDECEVCGKRFRPGPAGGQVTAPPSDWLEPTDLGLRTDGEVVPFAELEPTHHDPVAAEAGLVPDLEPTATGPVQVSSARMIDMEATAAAPIPGDGPSTVPAVLICRYCRTPAGPGAFLCDRCGMRLPVERPVAPPPRGPALTACPSCGTPGAGERCLACGDRRPSGG